MKSIIPMSTNEVYDVPVRDRVFFFWQRKVGSLMPPYISLCLATFTKHNPDKIILWLNYDNIEVLLEDDTLDWVKFAEMPLSLQSDYIKTAVVFKYGGLFLDVDLICTASLDWLYELNEKLFVGVGEGAFIHLAFIYAKIPKHLFLFQVLQIQKIRIEHIDLDKSQGIPWYYMGNSIYDNIAEFYLNSEIMKDLLLVIPNKSFLAEKNFETSKMTGLRYGKDLSNELWIKNVGATAEEIFALPKYGMIFLHNSWLPNDIKDMSVNAFLNSGSNLSPLIPRNFLTTLAYCEVFVKYYLFIQQQPL